MVFEQNINEMFEMVANKYGWSRVTRGATAIRLVSMSHVIHRLTD